MHPEESPPEAATLAPPPWTAVRRTTDRGEADRWSLALASQGVSSRLLHEETGAWVVVVSSDLAPAGRRILEAYVRENAPLRPRSDAASWPETGSVPASAMAAAIGVAAVMVLFHAWLVATHRHAAWVDAGGTAPIAIRSGHVATAFTALTLHADAGHVLSNALFGVFFGALAFAALGPGVGLCLIVAAGGIGNVLNAVLQGPGHSSIGASTAVFGAVGLLAGLGLRPTDAAGRRRSWMAVAAGIALLALLGTGEHTDVLAHLMGFLAGLGLGVVAAPLAHPPLPRRWQLAGALSAAGLLVAAWLAL